MSQEKSARIVFIGCRDIGFHALKFLLEGHRKDVVSVYTLDESQKENTAYFRSFKELESGMPFNYVTDINASETVKAVREDAPSLIVTVGWSQIISKDIISIPKQGCVGFHSSLLPKYAGGSPVNWGIINGEKEWGITLFYLTSGLDDGDIVAQKRFGVAKEDTCKTVYDKAAQCAVELLRENLRSLIEGTASRQRQDPSQVTRYKRRKPEDGVIDWHKPAQKLYDWVRAQTHPYPGAFTYHNGKKIFVWSAKELQNGEKSFQPGTVTDIKEEGIVVSAGDRSLLITALQIEGEKEHSAEEIMAAKMVSKGDVFTAEGRNAMQAESRYNQTDTSRWKGITQCSFSFGHYKEIVKKLQARGYKIYTCKEFASCSNPQEPYIILRHDIEYRPDKAEELARIENEMGVKSTFFFRTHAKEYNLFNFKAYNNFHEVARRGHEIALHAENLDFANTSSEDPAFVIRKEKGFIEFILGKQIEGVSPHGDLTEINNLNFWENRTAASLGFSYMAYEDQFFAKAEYISDSLGRWKRYPAGSKTPTAIACVCTAIDEGKNIYALIHERTWYHKAYFLEY